MKKTKNSGFTLIELVIAIAMLAFVMTAVMSFMASGIFSYKKAKADIAVHNNAQSVYNEITDATMEANNIVMLAYINEGSKSVDFTVPGEKIADDVNLSSSLYYIVRDAEAEKEFKTTPEYMGTPNYPFKYFTDIKPETELYLVKLIVECAEDIDITECYEPEEGSQLYYDTFATEKSTTGDVKKTKILVDKITDSGEEIYNVKDTVRKSYIFEEKYMYLQKRYRFMIFKNDYLDWDPATVIGGEHSDFADNKINYRYCESFSYVNLDGKKTLAGVIAKVDANAGTVYYELKFNDKNMTYDSSALPQVRNSYVLKPKGKVKTQSTTINNSESDTDSDEE